MKASVRSDRAYDVDIYLDGKKQNDCIQADEETGVCWVGYRGVDGRLVSEVDAEPGALFYEGAQVIKVKGKVEIKVLPREGESEDSLRELIDKTSAPIRVYFYADGSEPLK